MVRKLTFCGTKAYLLEYNSSSDWQSTTYGWSLNKIVLESLPYVFVGISWTDIDPLFCVDEENEALLGVIMSPTNANL